MASKSKKRPKGRATFDPIDCVKRSLDRGDYKQALKDARVWYRQSPTADLRCFLEHAYMGRAQQLLRNGLTDDARRIVGELMDLGVTETAVETGLPDLLLSVGMLDRLLPEQNRLTEEERTRLVVKAADQAVVKPGSTPASMRELRDEAQRIRAALDAVQSGDEAAALAHLKEISRQSVFADWKFFVRGLTAYYRRDRSEMEANWDRLDPDRAAVTIAAPLKVMAGIPAPQQDVNLRAKIARLEKQTASQTVLSSLMRLRQSLADHDWPQVVKTFRVVHQTLRGLDGDVYRRVIACLTGSLTREGCLDELTSLAKTADPLPLDPHWNRAMAVACENSEYFDDDPEPYWRDYLDDLENLPSLPASQRNLARGLVWLRLADNYLDDAIRSRDCCCGADHSQEIEAAEQEAEAAFRACMEIVPEYAPGYMLAAQHYQKGGRSEEAAIVYTKLLEHVPDHLDALIRLAAHHLVHGSPRQGIEYALRARELRPLDQATGELLWSAHLGAAQELAAAGRYDEARDALAAADRVLPARASDYDIMARKAVLEIKAKNAGAARRLVEQAQERLEEPTILWLAMTIEASRYGLNLEDVWLYEKRWLEALRRRCRSSTAGVMCRVVFAHLKMPHPVPDLQKYAQEVLGYVRRCTRVKWNQEDLRAVCEFLQDRDEWQLLMKFVKKGIRKFPELGYLDYLTAIGEMQKGPFRFNRRRAVEGFKRSIQWASKSSDPRDKQILEDAKRALDMAESALPEGLLDVDFDDGGAKFREGPLEGVPVKAVQKLFEAACANLGLDPDEVMDDMDNGRPVRHGRPQKTRGFV
jgi:tetratricopeptide (TPR) repeat protein